MSWILKSTWILKYFTKTILLPLTVNETLVGHWRIECFHSFNDIEKPGKIVFCSCESALENPESVRKKKEKKKKKKRKEKKEEDWSVGTQVHVIRLFCVSVDREHTKWSALARLEGWQGGIKSSTVLEPASTVYVGEILLKNGTENWLGKKTSSHLITGPFPSLFLLFRSRVRNDEQPRVEEGSNYATAVSPDNIKCPPRTVSSL